MTQWVEKSRKCLMNSFLTLNSVYDWKRYKLRKWDFLTYFDPLCLIVIMHAWIIKGYEVCRSISFGHSAQLKKITKSCWVNREHRFEPQHAWRTSENDEKPTSELALSPFCNPCQKSFLILSWNESIDDDNKFVTWRKLVFLVFL